jgi:RNA polymerase sigma-B factor
MATIDADLSTPVSPDASGAEARDRAIRDERVHSHLGLAHQLARRFSNRGETHDDLVQVASLALVRAAERFDPDRGVMFSTFAAASIIGELKRHFRDRGWAVRAPRRLQEMVLEIGSATDRLGQELGRAPTVPELAKEIRASEGDVLEALEAGQSYRTSSLDARDREGQSMAETLGSEDSGFVGVENHSALAKAMSTLSSRDREIVQLRFVDGLTQSEIAARLGVSQMQISRLLAASLRRLRSNIEARERVSSLSTH